MKVLGGGGKPAVSIDRAVSDTIEITAMAEMDSPRLRAEHKAAQQFNDRVKQAEASLRAKAREAAQAGQAQQKGRDPATQQRNMEVIQEALGRAAGGYTGQHEAGKSGPESEPELG